MTNSGRVVVVGAGLAGWRTAEELRERGFTGPITLIGAESWPPYDRPPLSKKVLIESALDPSLKADFAALGVDFHPDEAATGLDDGAALVTTRGTYPYEPPGAGHRSAAGGAPRRRAAALSAQLR